MVPYIVYIINTHAKAWVSDADLTSIVSDVIPDTLTPAQVASVFALFDPTGSGQLTTETLTPWASAVTSPQVALGLILCFSLET